MPFLPNWNMKNIRVACFEWLYALFVVVVHEQCETTPSSGEIVSHGSPFKDKWHIDFVSRSLSLSQLQRPTVFIIDVTSGLLNELPFRILIELCDWNRCRVNKLDPQEACWESHSSLQGNNHALLSHDVPLSSLLYAISSLEKKKNECVAGNAGVDVIMTIQPEYKLFCPIFPFYFCQTNVVFYFRIQECFQRRQSNFHLVT